MLTYRFILTSLKRKTLKNKLKVEEKARNHPVIRRILAILGLDQGYSFAEIASFLHVSETSVRSWFDIYLLLGAAGLNIFKRRGRKPRLTKSQKKELGRIIDKGPAKANFVGNCWRSPMIQELIHQRYGVMYSVHYISQLLKNMGFSFQKARFVSDHLNKKTRKEWLEEKWPEILQTAKKKGKSLILFGDEASFPQWGSLGRTWARKGKQPTIETSGKRKGYKVFGLIDYLTGRFFYKCQEERMNSETYKEFLLGILNSTTEHIFLIQDGASYHTSKATKSFFEKHKARITVYQLPSYSPDYNPIEKLWKKIKEKGTHLHYFPTFESLKMKVHESLLQFKNLPQEILSLCGMYKELEVILGGSTGTK